MAARGRDGSGIVQRLAHAAALDNRQDLSLVSELAR